MNKKVLLDELEINYYEKNEGNKETIVFVHGNSGSANSFENQKENSDLSNFRIILIDLPGHGKSSKSDNYSLPNLGRILSHFISELKLEKFFLVGHSLGGHVVLHSLKYLNPSGICIYGTPPIKKPFDPSSFLPSNFGSVLFTEAPSNEDVNSFLAEVELSKVNQDICLRDFAETDPSFRSSLFINISNDMYENEMELLNEYRGKVLIILSTKDSLINNEYILNSLVNPNVNLSIESIEANHYPHIENYSEFNKVINKYLLTFNH